MLKKQVTQYGFYDKSPGQTPRKDSKKERREKRRKEREKEREKEKEREREKERQKERERRKKKDGPKTLDSIIVENTGSEGLDQVFLPLSFFFLSFSLSLSFLLFLSRLI